MLHCKQQGRVTFRPTLEVLEGRLTPANFHWQGGMAPDGSAWTNGSNWYDDNGNYYPEDRYPGSAGHAGDDVAMFGYHALDDCLYTGGAGSLAGLSSDEDFDSFNLTLNANLAVEGTGNFAGGLTTMGPGVTNTYGGLVTIKNKGQVLVQSGATLVCNGDAAYTWNADTLQQTSLAVDGGTSGLTIDGGGTVQVAQSAFFANFGTLAFTSRGTTDAWFTGNGGKVWFDSGTLLGRFAGGTRNFNIEFSGLDVQLSRDSNVYLGVLTVGNNSQWSGIDVWADGFNGGRFWVDTTANDNVTLNMNAAIKQPVGSSHNLIHADLGMSGYVDMNNNNLIFQKFNPTGDFKAWKSESTTNNYDFVLTW